MVHQKPGVSRLLFIARQEFYGFGTRPMPLVPYYLSTAQKYTHAVNTAAKTVPLRARRARRTNAGRFSPFCVTRQRRAKFIILLPLATATAFISFAITYQVPTGETTRRRVPGHICRVREA